MNHSNKSSSRWRRVRREGADQGEHPSVQHAPDTERGLRVTGAGGCAESSKGTQGDEVHRSAPPCHSRSAKGQLRFSETQGCSRCGWEHGRRMKPGWRSACRSAQPCASRRIGASSRRVYIEKATGGKRPLGSPHWKTRSSSTRVTSSTTSMRRTSRFSYGFRPGRSQHKALDALVLRAREKER